MQRERLTIVHVTTFYPPHNFGGDGMHVQRLSRALARRGHRVSVVCAPAAYGVLGGDPRAAIGDAASDDGVTVHRLDGGWRGALETVLVQQLGTPVLQRGALRRLLGGSADAAPDVIHYHNVSLVGGMGVLGIGDSAAKLYTTHEYWLTCPTHLLFRYNRAICERRTCVRCTLHRRRPPQLWRRQTPDPRLRHIDRFIFPSALTESVYRAQGVQAPGTVLHHFLPDAYLDAATARGDRRPDAEPYFLYVGRMDAVKGVDALLRRFAAIDVPAHLLLAGDGPLAPTLRQRYGGHPRIRFLGALPASELGAMYRDARALILPSAGYEVFGLVVLEAFAHGTPAVVTAVSGAAELVRAADGGFVYASDDALDNALRQLSNDALRDRLGAGGRAYVRGAHREDAYVDRYEELIREIRRP